MNVEKRKRKHASTNHTARLFAGIFILCGFLLIILAVALPLGTPFLPVEIAQIPEVQQLMATMSPLHRWTLGAVLCASVLIWLGYTLKVLTVIAETQIVDLSRDVD